MGVDATIDLVSRATWSKRMDTHDFDMLWINISASRLRDPEASWSSKTADEVATNNCAGVKDPEIDQLIDQQRESTSSNVPIILREIDTRLSAINPFVRRGSISENRILYWNKFGAPKSIFDKFNREDVGPLVYWWLDPEKESALLEAMKTNTGPPEPAEIIYSD